MKVYTTFWWWDLFLHGMFGSYAVLVALHLIQGVIIKEKETTEKRFTIFPQIALHYSLKMLHKIIKAEVS